MEIVAGYVSEYIRNLKSKDPILLEMEFYTAKCHTYNNRKLKLQDFLEF